jgi:hypothetical protein
MCDKSLILDLRMNREITSGARGYAMASDFGDSQITAFVHLCHCFNGVFQALVGFNKLLDICLSGCLFG